MLELTHTVKSGGPLLCEPINEFAAAIKVQLVFDAGACRHRLAPSHRTVSVLTLR
jgi:hypothetical protein